MHLLGMNGRTTSSSFRRNTEVKPRIWHPNFAPGPSRVSSVAAVPANFWPYLFPPSTSHVSAIVIDLMKCNALSLLIFAHIFPRLSQEFHVALFRLSTTSCTDGVLVCENVQAILVAVGGILFGAIGAWFRLQANPTEPDVYALLIESSRNRTAVHVFEFYAEYPTPYLQLKVRSGMVDLGT